MKLTFKERLTKQGNVSRFVFIPEAPLEWKPGQFMHYTLPHKNADDRGDERWFTISSAPFENEVWITTRITSENGSSFKRHLLGLNPGEAIEADGPGGSFVIEDLNRDYIFVAGGIGITPFRSIVNQFAHDGKMPNIELLYANRDEENIPFKDELETIRQQYENFRITYFIGDKRIDEAALKEAATNYKDPVYYVSGPEPMVEAFKSVLEKMGIDDQHSKFDYFPGYEAE